MSLVHRSSGYKIQTSEYMTQREVADELGISVAEVSMIERQALKKLRKMAETRHLCLPLARFQAAVQSEDQ